MTVSSTVEAKLRGRAFSTAPARAAQRVLGIKEFESPRDVARFSDLVHWGYGTGWGVVRALLGEVGLGSRLATPAHFGALWGSELVMLPSLDVAPPAYLWPKQEVAIDVFHHLVYALTTGVAYELLDHRS
jgi:uncharacterized membrane protein YagU involved in acid resistance